MKLYTSLTSPYGRKVRAVAIERNVVLELEVVTGPYTSLAIHNPLGKVPVLVRDDSTAVFDSPVIIELLDGVGEGPSLLGDGESRVSVGIWQALADGIMDATVIRGAEHRRPASDQQAGAVAHQQGKLDRALAWADERINDGFLVGGRFTLADIALSSAIGYLDFRHPYPWRELHPRLAAFVERVGSRPCLAETRPPE
jgi:glutathione S-transferase